MQFSLCSSLLLSKPRSGKESNVDRKRDYLHDARGCFLHIHFDINQPIPNVVYQGSRTVLRFVCLHVCRLLAAWYARKTRSMNNRSNVHVALRNRDLRRLAACQRIERVRLPPWCFRNGFMPHSRRVCHYYYSRVGERERKAAEKQETRLTGGWTV